MKLNLFVFAAMFLGICGGPGEVLAQSLPPTVDPGVQRDRLLDRDLLPRRSGLAVLREIDCSAENLDLRESFTLRGVHLAREVSGGENIDPTAYWARYLGQEITLERVCEFARALADDYAFEMGRNLQAILPVQYIDGGVVRIAIVAE